MSKRRVCVVVCGAYGVYGELGRLGMDRPPIKGKGHTVPINSAPVDQAAFTRLMLVSIEPKTDRETGVQFTSKDGTERKWTVQVVASMPSRFDPSRTDSEVLAVTVTCADDPTGKLAEGDQVEFAALTVGVMPPEQGESGRIRGGRLFWQATGVRSRSHAGSKS